MNNIFCRTLLNVAVLIVLGVTAGCAHNSHTDNDIEDESTTKKISLRNYPINDNGEMVLTHGQLKEIKDNSLIKDVTDVSKSNVLVVSADELAILKTDNKLLFSQFDLSDENKYMAFISKGSLRVNLNRLVMKHNWGTVNWSIPYDYMVDSPYAVIGDNFEEVVIELLANYPVKVSFKDSDSSNRLLVVAANK